MQFASDYESIRMGKYFNVDTTKVLVKGGIYIKTIMLMLVVQGFIS